MEGAHRQDLGEGGVSLLELVVHTRALRGQLRDLASICGCAEEGGGGTLSRSLSYTPSHPPTHSHTPPQVGAGWKGGTFCSTHSSCALRGSAVAVSRARFSGARPMGCYVTKFAPHAALKLIA